MRPLRVRIDVTEGTATPAQPDPQTIHLNAAQTQPLQERLLLRPTQALPPPPEAAVPGASLPAPKVTPDSPSLPQQLGRLLTGRGGLQLTFSRSSAFTNLWISSRPGLITCFT